MVTMDTVFRGAKAGWTTSWMLLRIVLPVYAAVTLLGHTPVMEKISHLFAPVMGFSGLPGEAAIVFVTGAFVNIYMAVGIVMALDLTPWQITTLALMLNLSHELIVESAVLGKTGVAPVPIAVFRLCVAFVAGGCMHLLGMLVA